MMTSRKVCPECGADVPAGSDEGLCTKCVLQVAMLAEPDSGQGSAFAPTGARQPQFVPLTAEELDPLFPELEILDLLGHGGMGSVYRARQTKLDRMVALKIVRPDTEARDGFTERFNREARALAKLSHPNIVSVFDFGDVDSPNDGTDTAGRLFYFLMEYVDGLDLRRVIETDATGTGDALAIVCQICDALQYAHSNGVVHRDIKPENILLDQNGRVKIADFGLAKLGDDSELFQLTGTRQVLGTLRYMAPEQMSQSRTVDHRADVYSLGVVFYEMLTGEVPAGVFDPPSHCAGVDQRLDEVVMKALASDPDKRFQSAGAVSEQISRISGVQEALPSVEHDYPRGASTILEDGVAFIAGRIQGLFQRSPRTEAYVDAGLADTTLSRRDVEGSSNTPDVCVVCGQEASGRITRQFKYTDESVEWLIVMLMILFFPAGILVAMLNEKRCRATLPVCPHDRSHWAKLHWWAGLGWLLIVLCPLLVFGVRQMVSNGDVDVMTLIIAAGVGVFLYVVPLIVLAKSRVAVVKITDTEITLQRTATQFANAVLQLRSSR